MLIDAVEWLGHAGFRIDAEGATIYIDPYRVENGPSADAILVTHDHYDHFSPRDIEALSDSDTWLIGPPQVTERARGRVISLAPGELLAEEVVRGVEIAAVAAYNTSKRGDEGELFHPRAAGGLGFELRIRGERLYHAGDTDVIPEMDAVAGVDVALLPVSGTYVMTAGEASEAARRIHPGVAVPMHWGDHIGTYEDALGFEASAPGEVRIMEKVGANV